MKRMLIITGLILLVMAWASDRAQAFEDKYMTYSETATASGTAYTGYGYLYGLWIATDGTNAVTLDIYDNTAASGTTLIPQTVITTNSSNRGAAISFDPSLPFNTGVYVKVTCAGTVAYKAYYRKR